MIRSTIVGLLVLAATAGADISLKVGGYENSPLIFEGEDGRAAGLYPDVVRAIASEEEWDVEWVFGSWPQCLTRLLEGEIDILPAIAYTERRDSLFDFTEETFLSNWGVVFSSPDERFESILDLDGERVAVLGGDVYYNEFRSLIESFGVECSFQVESSYAEVFDALQHDRADACLMTRLYGTRYGKDYDVRSTAILFCPTELRFAAREGHHEEILGTLDEHLRCLKDDPGSVYYASIKKWLGTEMKTPTPWWLEAGALVAGALILVLVVSYLAVRRKMRNRTTELREEMGDRRRVEEALQESEEKYRKLVEESHDAIYIYHNDHFLFTNEQMSRLTGYSREELSQIRGSELIHPDDRNTVTEMSAQRKREGDTPRVYQARLVRKNGGVRLCEFAVSAITYHGRYAVLGAIRDVTRQTRMERELSRREKLESVGILAGGIAHDFNNFLTGMMGSVSLARMKNDRPEVERLLADVEESARQARGITQQLLTFSRGGEPVRELCDVGKIVSDSAVMALMGSPNTLDLDIDEGLWPAEVDHGQIYQAVSNMVINAEQAMPDGGTVRVSTANMELGEADGLPLDDGSYVRIDIEDDGSGIPDEHIGSIFDPFYSTKEDGSGLGLSTAYSVVRSHDGHITVRSEVGMGTRFSIYVPALPGRGAEVTDAKAEIRKGSGRILVMDDDEMVRNVSCGILDSIGYRTRAVANGEEAVREFEAAIASGNPYDAVILDLTVPGSMGGRQTMQKLTELDPEVAAIVSSGYANDPVMSHYREYGFVAALSKPYSAKEMAEVVGRVLFSEEGPG
ncbi:transporter substrate-binding domain-containing protein [Candidatus Fermentibacteria bacterium]|nr:transporter substrate-binding domain-containing protein [Candidatus Fermentibacteria bacterium]